ncbi:hypothetical protein C2G38_2183758 [Gigaspora rosea]|uniref:Uncharacterized protein n=1 Tax=Gigaspora rosea TaxID=44941 RepID=A0A397VCS1_9GLOM|nr:hypothetical protein C2G38_2183758 [Gigaspora rosea]
MHNKLNTIYQRRNEMPPTNYAFTYGKVGASTKLKPPATKNVHKHQLITPSTNTNGEEKTTSTNEGTPNSTTPTKEVTLTQKKVCNTNNKKSTNNEADTNDEESTISDEKRFTE